MAAAQRGTFWDLVQESSPGQMQVRTIREMNWPRTGDSPGYKGGTVKQDVGDTAEKVAPGTDAGS